LESINPTEKLSLGQQTTFETKESHTQIDRAVKISDAGYRAAKGVSKSSVLDKINKSPAYYQHCIANPPEQTTAMRFGSAVHEAILLPQQFKKNCAVMPSFDRRTKEGKKQYEEWIERHDGLTILTADEEIQIVAMVGKIYSHSICKDLLSAGHPEQAFFWTDPDTNVLCKCRPDFLRAGNILIDVKTTGDCTLKEFTKSVANFRYHVQAAFYLDGVSQVMKTKFEHFIFIAIEKEPPYEIQIFDLDYRSIEQGREEYKENLITYARCEKENYWPGMKESIEPISLPIWAMRI